MLYYSMFACFDDFQVILMEIDHNYLRSNLLIIKNEYNLHKDHNASVWDNFELEWSKELVKEVPKLTPIHYFDHNF